MGVKRWSGRERPGLRAHGTRLGLRKREARRCLGPCRGVIRAPRRRGALSPRFTGVRWSPSVRSAKARIPRPEATPALHAHRHRDRPRGDLEAHCRRRGRGRHSRRGPAPLRPPHRQGGPRLPRRAAGAREAGAGDRDQPDARRRGQDHHHHRPRRRAEPHRPPRDDLPARALPRPLLRPEGRRHGRRTGAGAADGGDQPPLHRRLPRRHQRPQPPRRRSSTTTSTGATARASTPAASPGSACST